jgi:GMP synthase-like glutamine amidotransferase
MGDNNELKIAILDLYEGHANQGMRCIREIINQYSETNQINISWDEFDVRLKNEVPDLSYDLYISSGGPGSPLDTVDTEWEKQYFHWLRTVEKWNNDRQIRLKNIYFLFAHSFQLACRHYKIGHVTKRMSTAFGVFPMHMLEEGKDEFIFEGLNDPFYGVDSRDYRSFSPHITNSVKWAPKSSVLKKKDRIYRLKEQLWRSGLMNI